MFNIDESKAKTKTIFDLIQEPDGEIPQKGFEWDEYLIEEWKEKDIENVLQVLREFTVADIQRKNWEKAKEDLDFMLDRIEHIFPKGSDLFDVPEPVMKEIKKVLINYASKYRDDLLKHNGLFLRGTYPGGYTVFLDTVSSCYDFEFPWVVKHRTLRFRISEVGQERTNSGVVTQYGLSFDDLTNCKLVFLDEDGFELIRTDVGLIGKHGWATGEFHMVDSEYKKIAHVFLITDQDK